MSDNDPTKAELPRLDLCFAVNVEEPPLAYAEADKPGQLALEVIGQGCSVTLVLPAEYAQSFACQMFSAVAELCREQGHKQPEY